MDLDGSFHHVSMVKITTDCEHLDLYECEEPTATHQQGTLLMCLRGGQR